MLENGLIGGKFIAREGTVSTRRVRPTARAVLSLFVSLVIEMVQRGPAGIVDLLILFWYSHLEVLEI